MKKKGNYFAKQNGTQAINRDFSDQAARQERARAATEAFELQSLPEGVVRNGAIGCPFCGKHQDRIIIGLNKCVSDRCDRKFVVAESEAVKKLKEVQDQRARAAYEAQERMYGGTD